MHNLLITAILMCALRTHPPSPTFSLIALSHIQYLHSLFLFLTNHSPFAHRLPRTCSVRSQRAAAPLILLVPAAKPSWFLDVTMRCKVPKVNGVVYSVLHYRRVWEALFLPRCVSWLGPLDTVVLAGTLGIAPPPARQYYLFVFYYVHVITCTRRC